MDYLVGYLDDFKALNLSKTLSTTFDKLQEITEQTYPEDILNTYFDWDKPRLKGTLPFKDFSDEPNQIQQVKKLFTSLHYLIKAAKDLEKAANLEPAQLLNISSLVTELYNASTLLNASTTEFIENYQDEIGNLYEYFGIILEALSSLYDKTTISQKYQAMAFGLGKIGGNIIGQMALEKNEKKQSIIGELTLTLPQQIQALKNELDSAIPFVNKHAPNTNTDELEKLYENSIQLAESFKKASNPIYLISNLLRLKRQLSKAIKTISKEKGELDESTKRLIINIIARIKYEMLPKVFHFIDKTELQLLQKPTALSNPLMNQITGLYDLIISLSQNIICFEAQEKLLLTLEDESFIKARNRYIDNDIIVLQQTKNSTSKAQTEIKNAINNLNGLLEDGLDYFESYEIVIEELNEKLKTIQRLIPFSKEEKALTTIPFDANTYYFPLIKNWSAKSLLEKKLSQLEAFIGKLDQPLKNCEFKMEQRKKLKKTIHDNARIYPVSHHYNQDMLEIDEIEVISRSDLIDGDLGINEKNQVLNLESLSGKQKKELSAEYQQKLGAIEALKKDIDALSQKFNHKDNNEEISIPLPLYDCFIDEDNDKQKDKKRNAIFFKLNDGRLNYEIRSIDNNSCYLYTFNLEEAKQKKLNNCYILNRKKLYYITPDYKVETVDEDFSFENETLKNHKANHKTYFFRPNEIDLYFNNHTPVSVTQGELSLEEFTFPQGKLNKIAQLKPNMPQIMALLYHKGLIEDKKRQEIINLYSKIQNFSSHHAKNFCVLEDGKISFEQRLVNAFLGKPAISRKATAPKVKDLKAWLSLVGIMINIQKKSLEDRVKAIAKQQSSSINESPTTGVINGSEVISKTLAKLINNSDVIQEKIDVSKKALFKVRILEEKEDIELKALETTAITHNYLKYYYQKLLELTKNHQPHPFKYDKTINEKNIILQKMPYFKVTTISQDKPKPNILELHKTKTKLAFRYVHYDNTVEGTIDLKNIKPSLKSFDNTNLLNPKTYASILDNIAKIRDRQIKSKNQLSADEALDLYFSYKNNLSSFVKAKDSFDKFILIIKESKNASTCPIGTTEKFEQLKPFLKSFSHSNQLNNFNYAFEYLKNNKSISQKIQFHHNELKEKKLHYKNLSIDKIKKEGIACLVKKTKAKENPRKNHLLKSEFLSNQIKNLKINLKQVKGFLNIGLQNKLKENTGNVLPFNDIGTENSILNQPHQVLVYKKIANLLYQLEKAATELEQIHSELGKKAYVNHLMQSTFAAQEIYTLYNQLIEDPNLKGLYQGIIETLHDTYLKLSKKAHYFDADENQLQSDIPYLTSGLNAIYELPEIINNHQNQEKDKANKTAVFDNKPTRDMATKKSKSIDNLKNRVFFFMGIANTIHQATDAISIESKSYIAMPYNIAISLIDMILSSLVQLPILGDGINITRLLTEFKEEICKLSKLSSEAAKLALPTLQQKYFNRLILEMDDLEYRYGIKPGLISKPVKNALDQVFLGLNAPLFSLKERIAQTSNNHALAPSRRENVILRKAAIRSKQNYHNKVNHDLETMTSLLKLKKLTNEQVEKIKIIFVKRKSFFKRSLMANDKSSRFPHISHRLSGCGLTIVNKKNEIPKNVKDRLFWVKEIDGGDSNLIYIDKDGVFHETLELNNFEPLIKTISRKVRDNNQQIELTSEQVKTAILDNLTHPEALSLPFGITEDVLNHFTLLHSCKNADDMNSEHLAVLTEILPLVEKSHMYLQGLIKSDSLKLDISKYQLRHITEESNRFDAIKQAHKRQVFEDFFDECAKQSIVDINNIDLFHVGYRAELDATFQTRKESFFKGSQINDLIKESNVEKLEQIIKKIIFQQKHKFDNNHLDNFKQLRNIQKATNKFNKYLNNSEKKLNKNQFTFESHQTIDDKREILDKIKNFIKDDIPVAEKIKNINEYFTNKEQNIPSLLASYHQANTWRFNDLLQLICELFYSITGQTPECLEHTTKLEKSCKNEKDKKLSYSWCHLFHTKPKEKSPSPQLQDCEPPISSI